MFGEGRSLRLLSLISQVLNHLFSDVFEGSLNVRLVLLVKSLSLGLSRLFHFCDNLLFQQPGYADSTSIRLDRKSTRLNSSHSQISYAVFCLKKKKKKKQKKNNNK